MELDRYIVGPGWISGMWYLGRRGLWGCGGVFGGYSGRLSGRKQYFSVLTGGFVVF